MDHLPDRFKTVKAQRGQALLLVLLGMAVVLTLVLSVVSRSVTDISITTRDEESLRAFSAAEAGVEKAFIIGQDIPQTDLGNQSSYTANVSNIAEFQTTYEIPGEFRSSETSTVWFVSHDADGNLVCHEPNDPCFIPVSTTPAEICWGKPGTARNNSAPALEISVYYDVNRTLVTNGNASGVRVFRKTFDPYSSRSNNFASAGSGCAFGNYAFSGSITSAELPASMQTCVLSGGAGCLLFGRIRMIYNSVAHPVAVRVNGDSLPSQGKRIESTGISGDATRKIEAFQTFKEPLSIFESAIVSMGTEGDLVKPD
jgi:hypothetical protein